MVYEYLAAGKTQPGNNCILNKRLYFRIIGKNLCPKGGRESCPYLSEVRATSSPRRGELSTSPVVTLPPKEGGLPLVSPKGVAAVVSLAPPPLLKREGGGLAYDCN